ncbi:hypothetical protein ACEPAG_710 [Sanghuangporus baumii]
MMDNVALRERGPVRFMGTLKLTNANRACLSEQGKHRLRRDLSRRFGREGEQHFNSPKFKVKINVCGELFAEPQGLDSSDVPTIVARDTSTMLEHEFEVRSLHTQTYALSRRYLAEWKLLREIITIADSNKGKTIVARTPRWLVSEYLKANAEHFHEINQNPSLDTRHVHRAEVYNLLAQYGQWLLNKVSKAKLLDKPSLSEFLEEAGKLRQSQCAGNIDDLEQRWPQDELMSDHEEQATQDISMEPEDILYEHDYQHTYRQVGGRQASSELFADWQILPEDEEFAMYTKPEVLAAVPDALFYREPIFPAGSRWYCPVDTCDYSIHLREAYRMKFKWMGDDDRKFLRSGFWCPTTDRAVELFNDIVEHHFYEHLRMAGIKHVARHCHGRDAMGNSQYELIELNGPRQVKPEYDRFKFEWVNAYHH